MEISMWTEGADSLSGEPPAAVDKHLSFCLPSTKPLWFLFIVFYVFEVNKAVTLYKRPVMCATASREADFLVKKDKCTAPALHVELKICFLNMQNMQEWD